MKHIKDRLIAGLVILIILSIVALFSSCSSKYLIYDFSLTHPEVSKKLFHENEKFSISFDIGKQMIGIDILNKMNDGIRINWDEVSFSINGKAQRAVHKETGVARINEVQPPTTIPPKSSLQDYLIPSGNVRFANTAFGGMTIISDLFPTEQSGKKAVVSANKYKNTKITIYLPFYIGGKYESYYYDIMINDVSVSKYSAAELEEKKKKK